MIIIKFPKNNVTILVLPFKSLRMIGQRFPRVSSIAQMALELVNSIHFHKSVQFLWHNHSKNV